MAPKASCEKIVHTTIPGVAFPAITDIITAVSMYDTGSLDPLSTSIREAVLFLRPSFRVLRIEKTDAASVELMTAPMRKLSAHSHLRQ